MKPAKTSSLFETKKLNPFKSLTILDWWKSDPDFHTAKTEIDSLLSDLEQIKTIEDLQRTEYDNEETQELGLLSKCDGIIHRNQLINNPWAKLALVAAYTVKMETYLKLGETQEIRNNYRAFLGSSKFLEESKLLPKPRGEVPEARYKNFQFSSKVREVRLALSPHLEKPIQIKEGITPQEMSVPDRLAYASYSSETLNKINAATLRRLYHELWEVESLRPMLTIAAYSTIPNILDNNTKEDPKNSSQEKKEPYLLRAIFGRSFNSAFYNISFGKAVSDNIYVKHGARFQGNFENFFENFQADYEAKGTIIHELHHFWEGLIHNNLEGSTLPYKLSKKATSPWEAAYKAAHDWISSRFVVQGISRLYRHFIPSTAVVPTPPEDPNKAVKERLNRMIEECRKITKEHSVEIPEGLYKSFHPFEEFERLNQAYKKDDKTQHAEIVVRVSNALGCMVGKDRTEEEVFKILRDSGLNECVDFFLEERKKMKFVANQLRKETGFTFAPAKKSYEVTPYLEYTSTPLHDAVRAQDVDLIRQSLGDISRDSWHQNPLELAFEMESPPEIIVELCKSEKMRQIVKYDPQLMHKTVMYLVDAAKNNNEEALAVFREMSTENLNTTLIYVKQIFHDVTQLTQDQELLKHIHSAPHEEILAEIESGKLKYRDKFGHVFHSYANPSEYLQQAINIEKGLSEEAQKKLESLPIFKFLEAVEKGEKPCAEELGENFETYVELRKKIQHFNDLNNKMISKFDFHLSQIPDEFMPTDPIRSVLLKGDSELFMKKLNELPHEAASEALEKMMNIRSPKGNECSVIEFVAIICAENYKRGASDTGKSKKFQEQGQKWMNAFEEITQKYQINIDDNLKELLPPPLKPNPTKPQATKVVGENFLTFTKSSF